MIKQLFAAAALAGIAATSFAAEPAASAGPAPTPFYLGVDGGATKPDYSGTHGSYGAFAGYTFAPNFAVEAGFRRLYDANGWGAHEYGKQSSLSVIGTLPITPSLGLYARLGVNHVEMRGHYIGGMVDGSMQEFSYSDRTTHGLGGIGLSYKLTGQVTARVEAQHLTRDLKNYSAGLSYAF